MTHRRFHSATLAILAILATAGSQVPAATGWPSSARPTLVPRVTFEPYDGGQIEHLTLEGGGVTFTTGNDPALRVIAGDSRHSILFENMRYPGAIIGLALFGRSEFLSSMESSSWQSYTGALRIRFPFELKILVDRPPEETAKSFPILGVPYRELSYQFRAEEAGPLIVRQEYFILMKDRLLVATLEAPRDWYPPVSRSLHSLLVGLDRRK